MVRTLRMFGVARTCRKQAHLRGRNVACNPESSLQEADEFEKGDCYAKPLRLNWTTNEQPTLVRLPTHLRFPSSVAICCRLL